MTLDNKEQMSKLSVTSDLIFRTLKEMRFERFGYFYLKVFSLPYDGGKCRMKNIDFRKLFVIVSITNSFQNHLFFFSDDISMSSSSPSK